MNKKTKILFSFLLIFTFFFGIAGTYLLIRYVPLGKSIINENISKVTIDEKGISSSVDKIYDSVVVVESYKGVKKVGSGTGFVYKKDDNLGYIVTNNHVVQDGDKVVIIFNNNQKAEATLLGTDIYADIASLSIDAKYVMQVATIGNSEESKLGDTVFTVGAPMGSEYSGTVTRGIVSAKDRMVTVSVSGVSNDWIIKAIQTDAAINPGNSGGPLVNVNGEVIGINSLKLVENEIEGMGFAIPIEDAMKYVQILEKGKEVERPFLGVAMIDVIDSYQLYLNNLMLDSSIETGVVIESVSENSPASKSGLTRGDVIFSINDVDVDTKAEFRYELYKNNVGDKIKIKYYHGKNQKEVSLTLVKQQ